MHIGDRLEQNLINLNFQSLNIVQIIDQYCAKYFANIWKILGKYNIDKNLANISQILDY